ncbi:hypothetical protein ACNOYE_16070 [Nannocystaceae bacterium ST9]
MPGRRSPDRTRVLAMLCGGLIGALTSCIVPIDERLSCGDGYVSAAEECDPADPDRAFVDACRELGFMTDASCDPTSCQILDSIADCNVCGDGVARAGEDCDGDDLRGQSCALGTLRCDDQCEFDFGDCPQACGDGVVSGDEECDFARDCDSDEDCEEGQLCYIDLGECVDGMGGFLPVISCVDYSSEFSGLDKPYASGNIGDCTLECLYARNHCSFCGDGELDEAYDDVTLPSGTATIPAEVCDGGQAEIDKLAAHCRPLCLEPPYDPDIDVRCDFECEDDCKGIAAPDDITPGEIDPSEIDCCLGPGSACVGDGVPDLPCCATPDKIKPDGCAWSATPPIALVCPGF